MYQSRYGEQHFLIYLSMDDSHNKRTTVIVEFLACSQGVKINPVARFPPADWSSFGSTFPAFPPFRCERIGKFLLGKERQDSV